MVEPLEPVPCGWTLAHERAAHTELWPLHIGIGQKKRERERESQERAGCKEILFFFLFFF